MNLIIKKEEVRNSINAVIAIYGNTPKFLGVYALVGAVLSFNNFKVSIYVNGYVTKLENPSFEKLKKILEVNKNLQVIVNPSNARRSSRDLNL